MKQAEIDAIKARSVAVAAWLAQPMRTDGPSGTPAAVLDGIKSAPGDVAALIAHTEQLQARLDTQQKEQAEARSKVTSFLEDLANGCVPVKMEPGVKTTPYWLGVNAERISTLQWAELKAKELGIEWPIKPIPYRGNLPAVDAPANPYAMPELAAQVRKAAHEIGYGTKKDGAACLLDCSSCQNKKGGVA